MRSRGMRSACGGALFVAVLLTMTGPAPAGNCALFAHAETGIALYGQAGGWWDQAEGRYARGERCQPRRMYNAPVTTRTMAMTRAALMARLASA